MTPGVPLNGDLALLVGDEEIDAEVKAGPPPAVIHVLQQDAAAAEAAPPEVLRRHLLRRRAAVQLRLEAEEVAPLRRDQRLQPRRRDDALLEGRREGEIVRMYRIVSICIIK